MVPVFSHSPLEVDIDVVQGILLLSKDIYTAYTKASHDLKRQYLSFFWERFEVADGVILKSVSSPLFEQLLAAEDAFSNRPKNENDASKASFSGVILTSRLLAWRGAFRTYDWAGIYSNLDFHIESTNRLLALGR